MMAFSRDNRRSRDTRLRGVDNAAEAALSTTTVGGLGLRATAAAAGVRGSTDSGDAVSDTSIRSSTRGPLPGFACAAVTSGPPPAVSGAGDGTAREVTVGAAEREVAMALAARSVARKGCVADGRLRAELAKLVARTRQGSSEVSDESRDVCDAGLRVASSRLLSGLDVYKSKVGRNTTAQKRRSS